MPKYPANHHRVDPRRSHWNLTFNGSEDGTITGDDAQITIVYLAAILDELQTLNRTLGCYRVQRMSDDIHRIDRRLAKKIKLRGAR